MTVVRSLVLFVLAALAEIGGAWLIWQGVREHRGLLWIGAGIAALGAYGFVATLQPDANFGRILAAYGGVFVAGSLGWGVIVDKFRPDRYAIFGAAICLLGVVAIMYAPRTWPRPNSLVRCPTQQDEVAHHGIASNPHLSTTRIPGRSQPAGRRRGPSGQAAPARRNLDVG